MTPNKLAVYFVADMVLADMVVADIDFPCGRYGFLLWPITSCCGRYGLWPIWSHPGRAYASHRAATTEKWHICLHHNTRKADWIILANSFIYLVQFVNYVLSQWLQRTYISIEYQCYDNSRDVIRITNAYHACDVDRVVKLTRLHGAAGPWQVVTPLVASGGFVDGGWGRRNVYDKKS